VKHDADHRAGRACPRRCDHFSEAIWLTRQTALSARLSAVPDAKKITVSPHHILCQGREKANNRGNDAYLRSMKEE
jgi:hypothetical protein